MRSNIDGVKHGRFSVAKLRRFVCFSMKNLCVFFFWMVCIGAPAQAALPVIELPLSLIHI